MAQTGAGEPYAAMIVDTDGDAVMLDHVPPGVSDFERSKASNHQALQPLGIVRLNADGAAAYGAAPKSFFWISHRKQR